jgi:hypothetical protein
MKFVSLIVLTLLLAVVAVAGAQEPASGSGPEITVPAGAPLTQGEIIILLQAKVPVEVIQKFVAARGTSFTSTKDVSRKILAAGGNVSLIGTINLHQQDAAPQAAVVAENTDKRKK